VFIFYHLSSFCRWKLGLYKFSHQLLVRLQSSDVIFIVVLNKHSSRFRFCELHHRLHQLPVQLRIHFNDGNLLHPRHISAALQLITIETYWHCAFLQALQSTFTNSTYSCYCCQQSVPHMGTMDFILAINSPNIVYNNKLWRPFCCQWTTHLDAFRQTRVWSNWRCNILSSRVECSTLL